MVNPTSPMTTCWIRLSTPQSFFHLDLMFLSFLDLALCSSKTPHILCPKIILLMLKAIFHHITPTHPSTQSPTTFFMPQGATSMTLHVKSDSPGRKVRRTGFNSKSVANLAPSKSECRLSIASSIAKTVSSLFRRKELKLVKTPSADRSDF